MSRLFFLRVEQLKFENRAAIESRTSSAQEVGRYRPQVVQFTWPIFMHPDACLPGDTISLSFLRRTIKHRQQSLRSMTELHHILQPTSPWPAHPPSLIKFTKRNNHHNVAESCRINPKATMSKCHFTRPSMILPAAARVVYLFRVRQRWD